MNWLREMLIIGWISSNLGITACSVQEKENTEKIANVLLASPEAESVDSLAKETSSAFYETSLTDLEGTPFRWKKRIIAPNYGNLLWFSQAENIVRDYNAFPDSLDFSPTKRLESEETIKFPLVYPELRDYFPERRDSLLCHVDFEKYQNIKTDHLLVVSQCDNTKVALAYYEKWQLTMASYVSAWLYPKKTSITGAIPMIQDSKESNEKLIFRRSMSYNNSPMPYALKIKWGYYLHQGKSDGKPRSHGCIRVPWLYQKWLYEQLPKVHENDSIEESKIPVIILEGLYTPTLFKQEGKPKKLISAGEIA